MGLTLEIIREFIEARRYRFSQHAEAERDADQIRMDEFGKAFLSDSMEILEERPDDPRGFSCLALGWTKENKPIHAVFGASGDFLIVVTVYRPDPNLWIEYRSRR